MAVSDIDVVIIEAGVASESEHHLFKGCDLDEILAHGLVLFSNLVDHFLLQVFVPHLHVEFHLILL